LTSNKAVSRFRSRLADVMRRNYRTLRIYAINNTLQTPWRGRVVTRLISLKALVLGAVVGLVVGGGAYALAQGGGGKVSRQVQAKVGKPHAATSCELPAMLSRAVEKGLLTQEDACATVEANAEANGPPAPPTFVVEGYAQPDMVQKCRDGDLITSPEDNNAQEVSTVECNALLKIDSGELKPTGTCGPPQCPQDGAPVWSYTLSELRQLPGS
jgi:hypothetical protein